MNEEIKAQWVAALRSGEYVQGRGFLNYGGEYCCLGVLCDLAAKAGVGVDVRESHGVTLYDDNQAVLPESVQEWAELAGPDPRVRYNSGVSRALVGLNDTVRLPFPEIADLIEEQL